MVERIEGLKETLVAQRNKHITLGVGLGNLGNGITLQELQLVLLIVIITVVIGI